MKVKKLIEWLKEYHEDYEMNFSEYTSIIIDDDSTSEEYFIVLDDPIVGMLENDDTKEVRLFTQSSPERVVNQIEKGKKWRVLE